MGGRGNGKGTQSKLTSRIRVDLPVFVEGLASEEDGEFGCEVGYYKNRISDFHPCSHVVYSFPGIPHLSVYCAVILYHTELVKDAQTNMQLTLT